MIGVLDGFGLAMFLPLLEMIANNDTATASHMGNLSFIISLIKDSGFELTLLTILSVMLIFFVLKGGFKFFTLYLSVIYQQFFIRNIREMNVKLLSNMSYEKFVLSDAGRIQNTMTGDVNNFIVAYKNYMLVIQSTIMVLVYTFLALLSNLQFALMVGVGGIITNFLFRKLYKNTKKQSYQLTQENHSFQGLIIQQVAFFKYLKATGLIKKFASKLNQKIYEIENSQKKIGILNATIQGIREPLLIGVVVVAILIEVSLFGGKLGLIILSLLFFYRALTFVLQLQAQWSQFLAYSGSIRNLKEFVNELKVAKEKSGKVIIGSFNNSIILEQVDYAYNKIPTLNKVSIKISKNETIAFVGESGSGKTTLMNLISGLLKPQNGTLLIDDIEINQLKTESYNNRIGYITQEPVIFNDTVFNNVTFWSEKSKETLTRFYDALNKASIYNFVMSLEKKEDSLLGNNGINLSGGQKQRLSIARELFKDIDILIMDEATSALDSETERVIQKNIDMLKGKYTIFIVAHRLSTIKNADRIFIIKDGNITKSGTYKQLLTDGTEFKRMVDLQEL
jgi:subfamily B ATP-binding cassette protein MsbA